MVYALLWCMLCYGLLYMCDKICIETARRSTRRSITYRILSVIVVTCGLSTDECLFCVHSLCSPLPRGAYSSKNISRMRIFFHALRYLFEITSEIVMLIEEKVRNIVLYTIRFLVF